MSRDDCYVGILPHDLLHIAQAIIGENMSAEAVSAAYELLDHVSAWADHHTHGVLRNDTNQ